MNETAIVRALLNSVLARITSKQIDGIYLALGELSELDHADLRAQWTDLTKGTPLEHAPLHVRLIPAEVQCMACFQKYHPVDKRIHCPSCGSFGAKILKGEEFSLDSIEAGYDQD